MRSELERIQLIEKHLLKTLSAEEKAEFQKELRENPNFEAEIQAQKELMIGIKKLAFKDAATTSYKKFKTRNKIWKWGIGGSLSLLVLALFIPLAVSVLEGELEKESEHFTREFKNSLGDLPQQMFTINNHRDTILETKEGIVIAVPASAFVDQEGKPAGDEVELVVQEALTPAQIMSAGLSTTSNGALLETGGMFTVDAFSNSKPLTLKKELVVEVPTDEIKEGMQLFDGELSENGLVNWVNPKPLANYLVPVEIRTLDFYPPGYQDQLNELGFAGKSKAWTDSVYYSFGGTGKDFMFTEDAVSLEDSEEKEAIDPLKIQTIWNPKFNNTNLATKEFEERLKVIFATCSHPIFELYVNNLDQELWVVDSMAEVIAPAHLKYRFTAFKQRKNGKVQTEDKLLKKLSKYYIKKQKKYAKAVKKLREEYWKAQEKAAEKFAKKAAKKVEEEVKRKKRNIEKEVKNNQRVQTAKLEADRLIYNLKYRATITNLGRKNIDRYVANSSSRRVQRVVPTFNPDTLIPSYSKCTIELQNKQEYDRIYSYLLADKLYSFQRMKDTVMGFQETLNSFLNYNLALIAYKGDSCFLYTQQGLKPSAAPIFVELSFLGKRDLKTELSLLGRNATKSFKKDILDDLKFEKLKVKEEERQQAVRDMQVFRRKVEAVIFPCKLLKEAPKESPTCSWNLQSKVEGVKYWILNEKSQSIEYSINHNDLSSKLLFNQWKFNDDSTLLVCSDRNKEETKNFRIRWTEDYERFSFYLSISKGGDLAEYVMWMNKNCGEKDTIAAGSSTFRIDAMEEKTTVGIVERAEIRAEFPGGQQAFLKWINDNLEIPEEERMQTKGLVMVEFIVYEDGSLREVKIVRGISAIIDAAVVDLLVNSPVWKPAMNGGKLVRERWRMPIEVANL